jgi:hypothetical protein
MVATHSLRRVGAQSRRFASVRSLKQVHHSTFGDQLGQFGVDYPCPQRIGKISPNVYPNMANCSFLGGQTIYRHWKSLQVAIAYIWNDPAVARRYFYPDAS